VVMLFPCGEHDLVAQFRGGGAEGRSHHVLAGWAYGLTLDRARVSADLEEVSKGHGPLSLAYAFD